MNQKNFHKIIAYPHTTGESTRETVHGVESYNTYTFSRTCLQCGNMVHMDTSYRFNWKLFIVAVSFVICWRHKIHKVSELPIKQMQWSTYPRLGLTGVLLVAIALISSNFLATKFPADFRVLSPPRSNSFLLVKLLGLKTKVGLT